MGRYSSRYIHAMIKNEEIIARMKDICIERKIRSLTEFATVLEQDYPDLFEIFSKNTSIQSYMIAYTAKGIVHKRRKPTTREKYPELYAEWKSK